MQCSGIWHHHRPLFGIVLEREKHCQAVIRRSQITITVPAQLRQIHADPYLERRVKRTAKRLVQPRDLLCRVDDAGLTDRPSSRGLGSQEQPSSKKGLAQGSRIVTHLHVLATQPTKIISQNANLAASRGPCPILHGTNKVCAGPETRLYGWKS